MYYLHVNTPVCKYNCTYVHVMLVCTYVRMCVTMCSYACTYVYNNACHIPWDFVIYVYIRSDIRLYTLRICIYLSVCCVPVYQRLAF
jgi:hypothetical protein